MIAKKLSKQYDGKTVVDGVSFEIPKQSVISMIGPNGAGKSTVLNILSRLIARDGGEVDFEGKDITQWKSRDLAKRLAILIQTNNIQMKLTVRELVTFGRFPYSGNHTTYILLDEPTNNLDIYHATNMMKIVRRLCDELGKTVILVLHEINYAAFYSDYICASRMEKSKNSVPLRR